MDGRIITNDEKRAKYYRWIAYAKRFGRIVPLILQVVCVIAFIPLLVSLTPYIDGSQELETAMTPSQLTAMFLVLVLCYGVMMIGKMGKVR